MRLCWAIVEAWSGCAKIERTMVATKAFVLDSHLWTVLWASAQPVAGSRATVRYLHVSPYKIRQVLQLVRGLPVDDAERILQLCEKDAAGLLAALRSPQPIPIPTPTTTPTHE